MSYTILSKCTKNTSKMFYDICPSCWSEYQFVIDYTKGIRLCTTCGFVVDEQACQMTSLIESHGSCFPQFMKENLPRKHSENVYKRCNHFKNWIKRIQGKESQSIPTDVLDLFRESMVKYNITEIDFKTTRFLLKRLKCQRYYNHTYLIIYLITGERIVDLQNKHEKAFLDMFVQVQHVFSKMCGKRVNMLSYSYLIRKFAELKGWTDLAFEIPTIKSSTKLQQQDMIWKKVCDQLNFTFIKSTF